MASLVGAATTLGGMVAAKPPPLAASSPPGPAAAGAPAPELGTVAARDAFLKQYCLSCHSAGGKAGGLVLEGRTTAEPSALADLWERVAQRVRDGEMPPAGAARRPDADSAHRFAAALFAALDTDAARAPYAGATVVRRLNRTEYGNAVRDLFGVDFPYAADLPPDGVANGFDNVADALSMSPVLLESYLKVGRKVTDLALGLSPAAPTTEQIAVAPAQSDWVEGAPFGTRGGAAARWVATRDGDYELRAVLNSPRLATVEGQRLFRVRAHLTAGPHLIATAFPASEGVREGPVPNLDGPGGAPPAGPVDIRGSAVRPTIGFWIDGQPLKQLEIAGATAGEAALGAPSGPPFLVRLEVSGPYDAGAAAYAPGRERVLICQPARAADETACARRILTAFARRAFRREVAPGDVQPYLAVFERERRAAPFDKAIGGALRDMLLSIDFLYRLELDPKGARAGVRPLNDYELATRLSFFLWSSIPDDELLAAARSGRLRTRAGLEREARRMLADRKSEALVNSFAAQWLGLRAVAQAQPDVAVFPEFSEGLRADYLKETQLFLASIVREDRPLKDVLSARYTFLNETLAQVYGVPGVRGPAFQRVMLPAGSPRGGILGQGSVLMATSHANKTSPVLRGKWVLDNLLNAPPKPPPPGVPPLSEAPENGRKLTTREQVERHRKSPVCSSCHVRMDPYGFALENFDPLGRWRDRDEGGPIDPTSDLPGGVRLSGIDGLRHALLDDPSRFAGATTERLMVYGLGRALTGRDQPQVRRIVAGAARSDFRLHDLILGVVASPEFRFKEVAAR